MNQRDSRVNRQLGKWLTSSVLSHFREGLETGRCSFEQDADRLEGAPVMCRGTEPRQRFLMFGGAVALVLGEAIAWILLVEIDHHPVARDFGDDRGGRDRQAFA